MAASCIGRARPHHCDAHRGQGRFSSQTRNGRYSWARYYHTDLQRFISEDPIEFGSGDTNLYVYVGNSPTDFVDPSGLWAIVDDILFTAGGGVVGLIGQGAGDLISGQRSSGLDYLAAFIGGAAGGEALLYTGPVGAGAIGGAVTSLTKQGLHCLAKRKCTLSPVSLAVDTGIGALTGFIPGLRIPGITAGRNSYNAIFKQITTKFQRDAISSVTLPTAVKMFFGRAASTSLLPGAGAGAAAGVGAAKIGIHE